MARPCQGHWFKVSYRSWAELPMVLSHAESLGVFLVITSKQNPGVFFNPTAVLIFSISIPFLCCCHMRCPQGFLSILLTLFPFSPPVLQMPGGRCSPCHPTTAARSLPVPPGLPFCSTSQGCPRSASSVPSPRSEPAAAIRQLLLVPKIPAPDPGLSGSERPRLRGRGNGLSIAAGRAPSSPPLLPFSHVFGWD